MVIVMKTKDTSTRTGQTSALIDDLRAIIDESKQYIAITVNKAMTMLYWQIGRRINQDILGGERAKYGKEIVMVVSKSLYSEYGRGFSEKSIRHMMRFAEVFPDKEIVSPLMRQLSWSHFLSLIYLQDDVKREFYTQICSIEKWSTRTLRNKISSMLYERTALSKKPEELTKKELNDLRESGKLSPDLVFRDPYILDFLGLTGAARGFDDLAV